MTTATQQQPSSMPRIPYAFVCHDDQEKTLLARRGAGARDEPELGQRSGALEFGELFKAAGVLG